MEKEGQDDPRIQHGLRQGGTEMVAARERERRGRDAKRAWKTDWAIKDCR